MPPKVRLLANRIDPFWWAEANLKFIDGKPFSLDTFPALVQYYQDDSQVTCAQKAAQIGYSIAASTRFIHRVAVRHLQGIYYFPTDELRNSFVQSRFNPLVNDNIEVRKLAVNTDNVSIKQFGHSFAHFYGMKGITTKHSTPADCEVFDEVDRMGEKEIEIAQKRMENSTIREVDYGSTPTIPNYGINRYFLQSDQKYLYLKCTKCGKRSCAEEMPFPASIEQGFLSCHHCRGPLDPYDWEWVPKVTTKQEISGYSFSRLASPTADFKRILREFKRALNLADFNNQVLGLPYEDAETSVTEAHVLSLCGSSLMQSSNPKQECSMGVDIGMASGKGKHVCISRPGKNRQREIIWLGKVDRIGKLAEIIIRFGVRHFVIDAGPQRDEVEEFVKKYRGGKGWMCVYNESQKSSFAWNDETQIVSVNRTQSLDASQRALRESMIELPRRCEAVEDFAAHCASIARVNDQDEDTGIIHPRWIHRGADDFRHAFNYDCLNWMDYGSGKSVAKSIVKISASELYRTPVRNGKIKLGWL